MTSHPFPTNPRPHVQAATTRRDFLERTGSGFGMIALAGLLDQMGLLSSPANARAALPPGGMGGGSNVVAPLAPKATHFPARAKSVIWLFMYGGPSGFDTFDHKPALEKHDGQQYSGKIDAFFGSPGPLMKSPFKFARHGQSGASVSEIYPAVATCVDEIAFLKGCYAESNNHAPALFQMNTGLTRAGFPSAGSWVTYGLGTENQSLPGYVVMYDPAGIPVGGVPLWGSGFLPGTYQGTTFRPAGSPVLNLARGPGVTPESQRGQLDLLARMNAEHHRLRPGEADLMARVQSFELAYRMQVEAPELTNLSGETEETQRLYGLDRKATEYFGRQCLLARRMVERGVRFIQLYSGGSGDHQWDAHGDLRGNHSKFAGATDVPIAGLLKDLKRRGLLDSTLVVWGGEFGRLPVSQGGNGRDHNPLGFLTWMAGGGVKGGVSHGETDEVGHRAVVDRVSVHDLHATILHLLGIDHERLTYEHNGRPYRLTDVEGEVIRPILA